ncbi:hypothetical protein EV361DRAFT_1029230 [Lentinula raphanica]|nr:hypothetical protein EV361DRAFT_1029230 [Lentinula raphanica]
MLYHDKRFQTDESFPFVAFSQQQIKAAISSRFMSVDKKVLQDLTNRMAGEKFKTQGSMSSKKIMQSEIWSLINHIGAPTWYITISPCDHKHPICIYYADTNEKFDCRALVGGNPVANARFFHFLIQVFIKYVIAIETDDGGLFGPTSGYYCTVEQQGLSEKVNFILVPKRK